ncbi:hypothetical protein SELMODRAFT_413632 [Selaginella moellendorffii]|uniref:Uncharacterized protein n=1 Tax=Selaginella moellendorffii TaxID=88036 RepID=D8RQW7_SELML|nr:hypothetical protein SELMODRAFT_413632 [Selaginella moellendorffii]
MEAVMVEPAQDMTSCVVCLAEIGRVQERVVVIFHAAYPDVRDTHLYSVHLELLKLRRYRLMDHIRASLELSTCGTPQALELAFRNMNYELRALVGTSDCWDWCAQTRSLVVVLGDAHVCVFGEALASVILCRSGKDERPTRSSSVYRLKNASPPQSSSLPFYYHKERLTTADSYLIVASRHLEWHMDSDYTRIDALVSIVYFRSANELVTCELVQGLEEACCQIADIGTDECRTFAVVPVGELLRQKEKDLKIVCKVGSCKFVIKSGDILEWFVDGKNDGIVIPVGGQKLLLVRGLLPWRSSLQRDCQHLKSLHKILQRQGDGSCQTTWSHLRERYNIRLQEGG